MDKEVLIHQALHGYKSGHQLLAASGEFSISVRTGILQAMPCQRARNMYWQRHGMRMIRKGRGVYGHIL